MQRIQAIQRQISGLYFDINYLKHLKAKVQSKAIQNVTYRHYWKKGYARIAHNRNFWKTGIWRPEDVEMNVMMFPGRDNFVDRGKPPGYRRIVGEYQDKRDYYNRVIREKYAQIDRLKRQLFVVRSTMNRYKRNKIY